MTEAERSKLNLALQLIQEVLGSEVRLDSLGNTKKIKNNDFRIETSEKDYYYTHNIRDLLTSGFSESELRNFAFDNPIFKDVYSSLSDLGSRERIADSLVSFATAKLKMEIILGWAKHNNPSRYEKHKPYRVK